MNNLISNNNSLNNKLDNLIINYSRFTFCLTLFVILLILPNVYAQPIDSLVTEAIQNNPQLKSLKYKVQSAEFKSESVNNLPPPTLAIEFNQVPVGSYNLMG